MIDVHNRYAVCKKLGVEPVVIEKDFNSRSEVINWILDTQLNRRNITENQRTYLLGKRYKEEKKVVGRPQVEEINQTAKENKIGHSDQIKSSPIPPKPTIHKIAEQVNVSPKTVQRAEKFTEAVGC